MAGFGLLPPDPSYIGLTAAELKEKMQMARPKEIARVYIHTSLSQPVHDRMMDYLSPDGSGKPAPGVMRDFIEACVEDYFDAMDREHSLEKKVD